MNIFSLPHRPQETSLSSQRLPLLAITPPMRMVISNHRQQLMRHHISDWIMTQAVKMIIVDLNWSVALAMLPL